MKKILFNMMLSLGLSYGLVGSDLIERILAVQLQPIDLTISETQEVYTLIAHAHSKIFYHGDYAQALEIIMQGFQTHPQDWYLQSFFGAVIQFYAKAFSGQVQDDMIHYSQACFVKLQQDTAGKLSYTDTLYLNDEYFWSFGRYVEQYQAGQDLVEHFQDQVQTRGYKGYCWQGLAASYCAQELYMQGNYELAQQWAEKAVIAWEKYLSYQSDFYAAYIHYALALGILGNKKEMMKNLQYGADLIQVDFNFFEIKNIFDWSCEFLQ